MKVTKNGLVREVRENQVERHVRNGWTVVNDEKIILKPVKPKKNTEDTPAVEDVTSEQGEFDTSEGEA